MKPMPMILTRYLSILLLMAIAPVALAQESVDEGTAKLNEHLSAFEPYVGTWVCETEWADGNTLWAMNRYSIGMNGNYVEATTYAKDGDGEPYQRYKTTWLYNKEKNAIQTYGFTYDGTVTITWPEIDDAGAGLPIIRSKWEQGPGTVIKQEVQMNEDGASYQWRVWSSTDEEEWTKLMDGTWVKQKD